MRSILHVIGFALCTISIAAVLLSISGFGILFPIGITLIFLGLFFKTKHQKTVAADGVGLTFPHNGISMPTYPASPYLNRSSSASRSSSSSSTIRRDDSTYVDPTPYAAYSSYDSNGSSSSDCSSSSSYDSGSSSCGTGD